MSALVLPVLAVLASRLSTVYAQGTNATCNAGYAWMTNSLGQSPCLVSSYLFLPCSPPADAWVYPLTPTFHYNTPIADPLSATPCRCNTVLYSTIEACATCQGQGNYVTPWSTYSQNCTYTTPGITEYPENIPPGTAVPAWAYLDVTVGGTFDPSEAEALAAQSQSDSLPPSTASSTTSTSSSSSATNVVATTTATTSSGRLQTPSGGPSTGSDDDGNNTGTSSSKTNIAPIVGGVVGGVVALILIGGAIFFCLRRKRVPPSAQVDLNAGPEQFASYAPYSQYTQYGEKPGESAMPLNQPEPSPKLYDPNDPTTFPSAGNAYSGSGYAGSNAVRPPSHHTATSNGQPSYQQPSVQQTSYSGIPEL